MKTLQHKFDFKFYKITFRHTTFNLSLNLRQVCGSIFSKEVASAKKNRVPEISLYIKYMITVFIEYGKILNSF